MSDQYTPSTEEIRHRAVRSTTYPAFASPTLEVAFDRWLAAFKRDTEIALLERLADDARCCAGPGCGVVKNWLRGKANELRKERP